MNIPLRYGTKKLTLSMPDHTTVLNPTPPQPAVTPQTFKLQLHSHLQHSAFDLRRVIIVVADKTRLCEYPVYLPVLVEALCDAGMKRENLNIHIAYGTHAPQSETESVQAYGPLFRQETWIHHKADEPDNFVERGKTTRGTPIRILRVLLNASCIITFGPLSHHYFAGYGGGRKLLFPGLGEQEAIYHNHSLFLDPREGSLHHACSPGNLNGNPLADDLREVYEAFPSHLDIHAVLNPHGRVCKLLTGSGYEHFLSAAKIHAGHYEIESSRLYDTVFASCGGYPKDINFIQAHKSIHHAAMWVKDGGILYLLAECPDQIGSQTFLPWFECADREEAFKKLSASYSGNGGTALSLMEKNERIRIVFVTALDEQICAKIGIRKTTIEDLTRRLWSTTDKDIAVLPNAGLTVRKALGKLAS